MNEIEIDEYLCIPDCQLMNFQMFMKQSLKKPDPSPGEVSSVLRLLSELAFNGLLDRRSLPRLVFDTSDFEKLKNNAW